MISKNFVSRFAVTSRRKIVASAVIYGLSLAVRFTSAAGEEVEIPAQSVHGTRPVISILAGNHAQLPYQDWGPRSTMPIVLRHGWPPGPPTPGCIVH